MPMVYITYSNATFVQSYIIIAVVLRFTELHYEFKYKFIFNAFGPPDVGYHLNSSELGFFYFKDSIMKSVNHETLV